uniref:Uncharacterized protein n=1 Tax=Oryza glumipatula TaxID=40148 RepID=A0A0E0A264_9ORYZ
MAGEARRGGRGRHAARRGGRWLTWWVENVGIQAAAQAGKQQQRGEPTRRDCSCCICMASSAKKKTAYDAYADTVIFSWSDERMGLTDGAAQIRGSE